MFDSNYKLDKEDELRTLHITEISTDDEISDGMYNLDMQSLGTIYYDVISNDKDYTDMNVRGMLLQLPNVDSDGNLMRDSNGILFSGKYDMYVNGNECIGRDIELSEVIKHLQKMRDNVRIFGYPVKDAYVRRLPDGGEAMLDEFYNQCDEMEM